MRRLLIACGISGRLVLFIVLLFVAGSGECEAILVFTTPLGVAEFTARLNEAMPETTGQAWSDSTTDSSMRCSTCHRSRPAGSRSP